MKRITALQKQLNSAAELYDKAVCKAAEEARTKFVIPFCDKHGYSFISGMGGYSFINLTTCEHIDYPEEVLPKRLMAALSSELLYRANDLGSLIDDYTPIKSNRNN